ncbi:hypothetical protein Q3G72_006907 [Acer saccharum]|nr:hypothetical protein Q3G72_006907 [Acer saccharum]
MQLRKFKSSKLTVFSRENHFRPRPFSTLAVPCLENQQEREERQPTTNHGFVSLPDHPNPEISCFYQKGFSQITREATGKALHGLCITGLLSLGVFLNNTLISMYSRFGCARAARHVFDEMRDRNESSWNNMMSGLVRLGLYRETVGLFSEMLAFGVRPSGVLVASLMTGCGRSGFLVGEGVQVHSFAVKVGFLSDVFVGTSLLHFYGTYGLVLNARRLFEEMPNTNVVSWTSLMVGFLDNGNPSEVMNMYRNMRREDVDCNENTFATVITSCGLMENDLLGYQVLGHVIKFGLENNVSVSNSLISMFGNFGRVKEARGVFDSMSERDTISWNSMISVYVRSGFCDGSLRCFHWMRNVHKEINTTTLSTLLSVCGSVDNLRWGRGIHGLVVKLGLHLDVCVCNTLLGMYSEAGRSEDAEFVFQEMPEKDSISWNSLMVCYIQDGKCLDALKIFSNMLLKHKIVNYVSFTSALAACSDPEFVIQGKIIQALAILTGLHENLVVGNAILTMYAKSGMMAEAKKVFQMMPERNEVTWNAFIGGYAENGEPDEAVKAYKLMREKGLPVDYITIANVLGACLAPGNLLKHGMPIHAHIVLTGFESNKYVQNSLITMYAKCGDLNSSNYIFDGLANKNSVSWNAMIAANAHHGCGEEILKLISKMRCTGLELDQFSFSEGLAATAKLALLEEGQQLHGLAIKLGFASDLFVTNAAMDMYGKCGEIDDVLRVSPQPMQRARMSWNILISVFARHGHGGLVEEGLAYYTAMTKEFGVPTGIEHCKATERLFELNPSDDSAHVLYSNICATTGRWEDVENVRRQMGSNKIKKQPACSWVKLKDGVSSFGMGDKSHPQTLQIYSKLEELKKMIKEAGYVPDTSYALHDTDEEQKEQNLWDHSERVALAFGLINTPEGSTIRVFKNLRVCGDCHSVYKFISKIIRRRIILRDPYRFHHFSSGKCSCSDYWFDGAAPEPRKGIRSGHVPGSKCIPFPQLLDASQSLLPAEELKKRFEQEGFASNREA